MRNDGWNERRLSKLKLTSSPSLVRISKLPLFSSDAATAFKDEYEAWDRNNSRVDPYSELEKPFARRFDFYLDKP